MRSAAYVCVLHTKHKEQSSVSNSDNYRLREFISLVSTLREIWGCMYADLKLIRFCIELGNEIVVVYFRFSIIINFD